MVTHLNIVQAHGCLTSVIWPFFLTALAHAWYCANASHFKDGGAAANKGMDPQLKCLKTLYLHHTIMSQMLRQRGWMVKSLK